MRKIAVVQGERRKKLNPLIFITIIVLLFLSGGLLYSYLYISNIIKTEISGLTREKILEALYNIKNPTIFLSRNGEISAELFERYREDVKFEELPPHLIYAFLAAEDEDFFKHRGIDLSSIIRAAIKNIQKGRITQGGSTITQQLARNLFLTREKTLKRKIKEILYAIKIEQELTKEEILSFYLSVIYFGNGSWGIKSAARNYFHKDLKDLTIAESALLAALPKSPVNYSPILHPKKARERQLWVLKRMRELGFISEEEFENAKEEKIKIYRWESKFHKYFWFNEHIRRELIKLVGQDNLYDGFVVKTTLDEDCYKYAEQALRWGIERAEILNGRELIKNLEEIENEKEIKEILFPDGEIKYEGDKIFSAKVVKVSSRRTILEIQNGDSSFKGELYPDYPAKVGDEFLVKPCPDERFFCPIPKKVEIEGAMVVMDAKTGDVLCMIGGYDWKKSQFIRSVQAKRQIGSAVKPIIYTAAIESGLYNPATVIKDTPVIFEYGNSETMEWKPKNIGGFSGWVTVQEAIAKSINVATVRIAENLGIERIKNIFQAFGIEAPVQDLTVALGSISLSPLEMAEIYSTFANNGEKKKSRFIISVERKGDVIYKEESEGIRVIPPDINFVMVWMLRNVILHGTGMRARVLNIPVAGKTGTTDELRDSWFIGFTPEIVVAVWIGKDDFSPVGKYGSGPKLAVPVFVEFMKKYKSKLKNLDFEVPENIEFLKIDPLTGEISDSDNAYLMAFTKDNIPTKANEKVDGTELDSEFPY